MLTGYHMPDRHEKQEVSSVTFPLNYLKSTVFPLLRENGCAILKNQPRKEVAAMEKTQRKSVAQNRKAFHDYFIEDRFEAGVELAGTEVKSIRQGHLNLKDSFCGVKNGELFLYGMHISPYEKGNIFNKDPRRTRRLLMHKREILRLGARAQQDGYAIIPLSVYFSGPRVKVELGLAKGKKLYDKREAAAKRDAQREMDRARKQVR